MLSSQHLDSISFLKSLLYWLNNCYNYIHQVDTWPWVKFFKKRGTMWTLNEVQHTVVEEDIEKSLNPPDVVMCGSRLLYKFTGMNSLQERIKKNAMSHI